MGGIGNPEAVSEIEVRSYLRDNNPEANYLLDDYEFSTPEIEEATRLAVDVWNETPPPVARYSTETFPYRHLMLLGICYHLLRMAAYRYARNELNYEVSGGAVRDQSKAQPYHVMADQLRTEFMQNMRMIKSSIQAEIGWAAV